MEAHPILSFLLNMLFVLYVLVFFPVSMVIQCASRSDKSGRFRGAWVTIMFMTWPFGAYLYGLLASSRLWIRLQTILLICLLIWQVAHITSMVQPVFSKLSASSSSAVSSGSNLQTLFSSSVTPTQGPINLADSNRELQELVDRLEQSPLRQGGSLEELKAMLDDGRIVVNKKSSKNHAQGPITYEMKEAISQEELNANLMRAVQHGDLEMSQAALLNGADPNTRSSQGRTALMEAAAYGYLDVLKLLLETNADHKLKTEKGETAQDIAESNGRSEIVTYLKTKG